MFANSPIINSFSSAHTTKNKQRPTTQNRTARHLIRGQTNHENSSARYDDGRYDVIAIVITTRRPKKKKKRKNVVRYRSVFFFFYIRFEQLTNACQFFSFFPSILQRLVRAIDPAGVCTAASDDNDPTTALIFFHNHKNIVPLVYTI